MLFGKGGYWQVAPLWFSSGGSRARVLSNKGCCLVKDAIGRSGLYCLVTGGSRARVLSNKGCCFVNDVIGRSRFYCLVTGAVGRACGLIKDAVW